MQCQSETKGRNESLNLNKVAANSLHMDRGSNFQKGDQLLLRVKGVCMTSKKKINKYK